MDKQLRNALRGLVVDDQERRRRAMEPFVRATYTMFIKCLYRYLGNEVECEDVLEDVYADIWEDPSRLCQVTSEQHLLRTVYLYYMRTHLRQVYKRLNRHLCLAQGDLMNLVAPELGVLEVVSRSELQQILRRSLNKLKARECRAVELWSQGMSNRAIANELQTTVGATKMLLYRTFLKLRKIVNQYCPDESSS